MVYERDGQRITIIGLDSELGWWKVRDVRGKVGYIGPSWLSVLGFRRVGADA